MLIVDAEILADVHADLRCENGIIAELGAGLKARPDEAVVAARGGALLPGLQDHHLHLYAAAKGLQSASCGPPDVNDAGQLAHALRTAPRSADGWIRGVAYHECVAGLPDRDQLDAWIDDCPLRIQHRTGKLWLLNSAAVAVLGVEACPLPGVERDHRDRATGRLYGLDAWLRKRLGSRALPDLRPLSDMLAACGVTGVTDASPANDAGMLRQIAAAAQSGQLRQRVVVMGGLHLPAIEAATVARGAVKLMLDEHDLLPLDRLEARIRAAHRRARAVAIHCVTRIELLLALTALEAAGPTAGDRIEHASVCPDEAIAMLKRTGVAVVTQPAFVQERGDRYRIDVAAEEQPLLYRARSLIEAGIPLAGSSDAPYASADPWLAMRAAVSRRTRAGVPFNEAECLTPEQALALFTSSTPGAPPTRLEPGAAADFCLLSRPWREARSRLVAGDVAMTCRGGQVIYRRES